MGREGGYYYYFPPCEASDPAPKSFSPFIFFHSVSRKLTLGTKILTFAAPNAALQHLILHCVVCLEKKEKNLGGQL